MKKIAIFFIIIIVIICSFSYIYLNYLANYKQAQRENAKFEIYKEKEITGRELTTLINKAIDNNNKKEIEKDNEGKYKENKENSINIDIKFIDDVVIYNIEKIYNNGMTNFIYYYGDIIFKCNEVQYHNTTKKVKYMQFEQITQ